VLKLVLMSILLATVIIPFRNAKRGSFQQGLRRTYLQMLGFVVVWAFGCIYAYLYLG